MPKYPTISENIDAQNHYRRLRRKGLSHNLAEMLALHRPPGCRTDTQFVAGRGSGDFGTGDPKLAAKLKARGADPNGVYHSSLARFPGDPQAVVTGRDGIRKVCEKNGWSCEGTVNVAGRVEHTPLDAGPAEPIVARETAKEIARDPAKGATPKKRAATKAAVRQRLKGNGR